MLYNRKNNRKDKESGQILEVFLIIVVVILLVAVIEWFRYYSPVSDTTLSPLCGYAVAIPLLLLFLVLLIGKGDQKKK